MLDSGLGGSFLLVFVSVCCFQTLWTVTDTEGHAHSRGWGFILTTSPKRRIFTVTSGLGSTTTHSFSVGLGIMSLVHFDMVELHTPSHVMYHAVTPLSDQWHHWREHALSAIS